MDEINRLPDYPTESFDVPLDTSDVSVTPQEMDRMPIMNLIRDRVQNILMNPVARRIIGAAVDRGLAPLDEPPEDLPEGGTIYVRRRDQGRVTGRTHSMVTAHVPDMGKAS